MVTMVTGCGPGRHRGNGRRHRRMTPLVYKQHVPNVSEHTLGASGLPEGKITRDSSSFKDLVFNSNPDIIFKNEERSNADRMMSQRCKDKLNTLAIAVMNRWPGVRLRVTEAWDEIGHHARNSLHYEGRAVDITTSDRDRTKYGMLARLAVSAGFDWVYYESRSHIHCSVKSDSSIAIKTGGCFPSTSVALSSSAQTLLVSQLQPGDEVLGIDENGKIEPTTVLLNAHADKDKLHSYITLTTEDAGEISLTPNHLLYVLQLHEKSGININSASRATPIFASRVQIGDYIYIRHENTSVLPAMVKYITLSVRKGAYAPITAYGTIIVDGVYASCYADVTSHNLAHWSFLPIRLLYSLNISLQSLSIFPNDFDGIHWYAHILRELGRYVLTQDLWFS